jgi:Helix-turn-helix domain
MARAYSLDLRERVVAAVAAGESCRVVAARFKVSVASVVKWSQRFRATGSAAAYKVGGRRPLPRLLMPSRRGLPPVVACRGTNPSHAARSRPRAKVWASPTAATSAVALSTPIPGRRLDG